MSSKFLSSRTKNNAVEDVSSSRLGICPTIPEANFKKESFAGSIISLFNTLHEIATKINVNTLNKVFAA